MSIRVDEADVLAILGANVVVASGELDAFIADASLWVDNYLDGSCSTISADKLPIIEKYLTAHLYTVAQQGGSGPVVEARRADIAEKYAPPADTESGMTTFLRSAIAFDPCGIVEKFWLNRKRIRWRVGAGYQSTTGGP